MLSGPDHQPATAGAEPRSPWEPWRSIALRARARAASAARATRRALHRASGTAAQRARRAAAAAGRTSRRVAAEAVHEATLAGQASRRAALRARAAARAAGRQTVTATTRLGRTGGRAAARRGRQVGVATAHGTARLRRAAHCRLRRTRIAVSSSLASMLDRLDRAATNWAAGRRARSESRQAAAAARRAQPLGVEPAENPTAAASPAPASAGDDTARNAVLGAVDAPPHEPAVAPHPQVLPVDEPTWEAERTAVLRPVAAEPDDPTWDQTAAPDRVVVLGHEPTVDAEPAAGAGAGAGATGAGVQEARESRPEDADPPDRAGAERTGVQRTGPSAEPRPRGPAGVRPGPARRTPDGPGQRRRQRAGRSTRPGAGSGVGPGARVNARETAAVLSSPPPGAMTPIAPGGGPPGPGTPRPAVQRGGTGGLGTGSEFGADPRGTLVAGTGEAGWADPAVRPTRSTAGWSRPRGVVVPLPVPARTRVFAAAKLIVLATALGMIGAGVVVALAVVAATLIAGS
jgi:hypothetical protein